jgi:plastocyanin
VIRLLLLVTTLAVAAVSPACADAGTETATIAPGTIPAAATPPVTAATAAPSIAAAQPTSAPSSTPVATQQATVTQAPPQATAPPAPSGPVAIAVSARNLAFDRTAISVPRNASITVNFSNQDVAVAHDFGVSIPFVPHTETCNGPCQASITFDSGPPGTYTFQCSIHPEMVGPFIVQ